MVKYKLSRSKDEEKYTLLDSDIAALLNNRAIRLRPDGYAVLRYRIGKKRREMYIHTFVMEIAVPGSTAGMTVDHLNNDKLDNRRENLEVVSAKENIKRMNGRKWLKRKIVK